MTTSEERREDHENDGTMQKLLTSVAVIESGMESMKELLVLRFDNVDKNGTRVEKAIAANSAGVSDNKSDINQNRTSIAKVATWTTIIGSVIIVVVALSYLIS